MLSYLPSMQASDYFQAFAISSRSPRTILHKEMLSWVADLPKPNYLKFSKRKKKSHFFLRKSPNLYIGKEFWGPFGFQIPNGQVAMEGCNFPDKMVALEFFLVVWEIPQTPWGVCSIAFAIGERRSYFLKMLFIFIHIWVQMSSECVGVGFEEWST